jgi:hypothetical protein
MNALRVGIVGLAFGRLRFRATIPHGRGTRDVDVDMNAEDLLQLADCIRGCHQVYETATGQRAESMEQVRLDPRFRPTWIGHAVWHLERPDRLMPCPPHGARIIDVDEARREIAPPEELCRITFSKDASISCTLPRGHGKPPEGWDHVHLGRYSTVRW